ITYVQPNPTADLTMYHPAQLAARRREHAELYARWAARQDALREHDRKVRHFLLGLGAVVGTGVLAGLGVAGWIVYHALTGISPAAWLVTLGVAAVIVVPAA